jgi:hypothetical protein
MWYTIKLNKLRFSSGKHVLYLQGRTDLLGGKQVLYESFWYGPFLVPVRNYRSPLSQNVFEVRVRESNFEFSVHNDGSPYDLEYEFTYFFPLVYIKTTFRTTSAEYSASYKSEAKGHTYKEGKVLRTCSLVVFLIVYETFLNTQTWAF